LEKEIKQLKKFDWKLFKLWIEEVKQFNTDHEFLIDKFETFDDVSSEEENEEIANIEVTNNLIQEEPKEPEIVLSKEEISQKLELL